MNFEKYELDSIVLVTNAPGRSALNPIERRLAPLGRATSGVILEHGYYGSHFDQRGETINKELDQKNFRFAGETLSEIWNDVIIDKQPVLCMYVDPPTSPDPTAPDRSQIWLQQHVRTSQYLLQVSNVILKIVVGQSAITVAIY